jgi:hypothetical protein
LNPIWIGKKIIAERENRAFDVGMEYSKKAFDQKFINYLGPKTFNLMPINIKKEKIYTEGNKITTGMKKYSKLVIFNI